MEELPGETEATSSHGRTTRPLKPARWDDLAEIDKCRPVVVRERACVRVCLAVRVCAFRGRPWHWQRARGACVVVVGEGERGSGASVSARPARVPCGCVSVSVGSARVRVCVSRLLCFVRVED